MSSTREMSFATTGEIEAAKKRRLEADIKERDKEAQIAKTNLEGWKTSYYQKQAENEQKATEKAAEKETNSGLGISRKRPRTVEFGDDQKSCMQENVINLNLGLKKENIRKDNKHENIRNNVYL